jgi:adenylate cyclase class IV
MSKSKPVIQTHYEVEIRCHFKTAAAACKSIPFLLSCLQHKMVWSSNIYGLELFRSGQLLRMSKTTIDGSEPKYYLGWKGSDSGKFANIREEIDEVITEGIKDSRILQKLGAGKSFVERKKISRELNLLGHRRFMFFRGYDRFGYYRPLDVSLKLMHCSTLMWPDLLEIEKTANTREEALIMEADLREFADRFGLQGCLVREEPPTLLYAARFPAGTR